MLERVDRLASSPVVGRYYLVPAVHWDWGFRGNTKRWWPVIGPKHDDVEFFNFANKHYHVDPRFLTVRHKSDLRPSRWGTREQTVLGQPLNSYDFPEGPEPPQWRKMKCTLSAVEYPFGDAEQVIAINRHFAGAQCPRSKFGWICPHRHVQLGSIAPVDGVITCPLHGLRIDATTGRALGVASADGPLAK